MKYKLRLVSLKNSITPHCVDSYNERGQFWQQVSPNYFYKGCAVRFMNKYADELTAQGHEVTIC